MKNKAAGERLISAFLDLFMVAVLTLIVLIVFNITLKMLGTLDEGLLAFLMRPNIDTKEGLAFSFVMILIWMIYYGFVPWLMKGTTPAKKMLGFQVVTINGHHATLGQLLLRTIYLWQAILDWCFAFILLHLLSFQLFYDVVQSILALGFMALLIIIPYQIMRNEDGRGLHDRLAGTQVIIKTVDK